MPRTASFMPRVVKRFGDAVGRSKRSKQDDNSDESCYGVVRSFDMDNGEKTRLQSRAKRAQSSFLVNADHKKKNYVGESVGRKGDEVAAYSKASSKRKQSKVKYDSKTETVGSSKPRTIWVTKHKEAAKCAKISSSKSTSRIKRSVGDGLFKKSGSDKSDFNTHSHKSRYIGTVMSSLKTAKKTVWDKKLLDSNSEQEVKPKKRKRIQLDPYDISNKRLDDNEVVNEGTKEKKDPEKMAEMSKNAQFRAIQPSPSILSFVEDNLLGRRRLIELKRAGYNIELSAPLDNIPFSKSSERENIEENIFRNRLEFFAAAKISSSIPPRKPQRLHLQVFLVIGRSNVGKSSLLNALTRQWGVVRTSDKPGHTKTINFFKLGPKINLVDLPGYGFAYAKDEVKDAWEELVKEYVSTRVNLKRVCLLVDTKWGMKPRDRELIDLMERYQTKYQIVLTKTDAVFPMDVARRAVQIEENLKGHRSAVQPVMMVSSKSGAGVRCLRTVLAKIARFAKV